MSYEPFRSLRTVIKSASGNNPLSRRDLLIGSAEAVASAGLLYLFGACATEELSYTKAKENRRFRQRYIDSVVRKYPIDGLESATYLDYIPTYAFNPILNKPIPMLTTAILPPGAVGAKSAKIEVFPPAFLFRNEDEFLSAFVDHEYVHVRLFAKGIEIDAPLEIHQELGSRVFNVKGDLFDIFQELEAFSNQIRQFPNRRISRDFRNSVLDSYDAYRQFLKDKEKTPVIAWMLDRYPPRQMMNNE